MRRDWWEKLFDPPFIGFKVLAVVAALLVWAYVTVEKNPVTDASYAVTVEMRNLAADLAIPDTNIQVTVEVQGSTNAINALSRTDITAYVDFADSAAGEVTVPVKINEAELENVTVTSVLPESLTFTLEEVATQTFPVEAKVNGELAENYTALSPVLSPEQVTLSGSASYIAEVASVYVSADVSGIDANYTKILPIEVLDRDGNNITAWFNISPSTAELLVPVIYTQPDKTVSVSADIVGEPAPGYEVSRVVIEPATVTAYGDQAVLNNLNYVGTRVIDIAGISETTTYPAQLLYRDDVTLSTETVTVVVYVEASYSQTFTVPNVDMRNLAEGLEMTVSPVSFSVVVYGPEGDVSRISAGDITLYADLSHIVGPGDYMLDVHVNLPANTYLSSVTPTTVPVTVTSVEEPVNEH